MGLIFNILIGDFGTFIVHTGNEIAEASTFAQTSVTEEPRALPHVESTLLIDEGRKLTEQRCLLFFLYFPFTVKLCNSSRLSFTSVTCLFSIPSVFSSQSLFL